MEIRGGSGIDHHLSTTPYLGGRGNRGSVLSPLVTRCDRGLKGYPPWFQGGDTCDEPQCRNEPKEGKVRERGDVLKGMSKGSLSVRKGSVSVKDPSG